MSERVAAIFTLGSTVGGCEFALRSIRREFGDACDLYFLYGKPFEGQREPTPVTALAELRRMAEFEGMRWMETVNTDGASIDHSYKDAVKLIRKVNEGGYSRVYVGVTGGTNAMVAALFHAAMSELRGDVVPLYVQGRENVSIGIFHAAGTRERIVVDRALELFATGQIGAAVVVARQLGSGGVAGFVRESLEALAKWDGFDYQQAAPLLQGLSARAEGFGVLPHLSGLAEVVRRLGERAGKVADLEAAYLRVEKFAEEYTRRGLGQRVREYGHYLPADALANARRRLVEASGAEAVLRSYRAVEIAVQARLFALGVHPSRLDWEAEPLMKHRENWEKKHGPPPAEVSFERGVRLLEMMSGEDFDDGVKDRRYLQNIRNHSYLEHGYVRVKVETGQECLARAERLCESILGRKLEVEHFAF